MPKTEVVSRELDFEISADDSRFHTCFHVLSINPLHMVHACHVQGDDHSLFFLRWEKGVGNVGASTVRDDAHVVLARKWNDLLHLVMVVHVHHDVNGPGHLGVTDFVQFLHRVSMGVHDTMSFIGGDFFGVAFDSIQKSLVQDWWVNWHFGLRRRLHIDVEPDVLFTPGPEVWQHMSTEEITAAGKKDLAVLVEGKFSVLVPPPTFFEPIGLVFWPLHTRHTSDDDYYSKQAVLFQEDSLRRQHCYWRLVL